jgi:glycosyltransferase involved in cell wall biosynthesis
MKLSIIIPVYNERATVGEVIERVKNVDICEIQKELIVIDDGSTAKTILYYIFIEAPSTWAKVQPFGLDLNMLQGISSSFKMRTWNWIQTSTLSSLHPFLKDKPMSSMGPDFWREKKQFPNVP